MPMLQLFRIYRAQMEENDLTAAIRAAPVTPPASEPLLPDLETAE